LTRDIATRYDNLAIVYRGGAVLAAIITWLRTRETRRHHPQPSLTDIEGSLVFTRYRHLVAMTLAGNLVVAAARQRIEDLDDTEEPRLTRLPDLRRRAGPPTPSRP
jgi:hypothetical protein